MDIFTNKSVVVTGAAGALGLTVANAFAHAGANVTGIDVIDFKADFRTLKANLIELESTKTALAEVRSVDILVNIAGGFSMGDTVAGTSDETWDFMFDLNARTVLNTVRFIVPVMVEQGAGKIINIGARAALRGSANMAAYAASKSVVIRLTESLADELKHEGINVNCILPSIIDTERNRADMPDADFSSWVSPEALAKVVLFLASQESNPIHGAALPVEGLA